MVNKPSFFFTCLTLFFTSTKIKAVPEYFQPLACSRRVDVLYYLNASSSFCLFFFVVNFSPAFHYLNACNRLFIHKNCFSRFYQLISYFKKFSTWICRFSALCRKRDSKSLSLRASSPIWASETSLARSRERAAKPRGAGELARRL